MKVLISAVAAAMILCGSAAAQTPTEPTTPAPAVQAPPSRCGEFPAQPQLPDGASASVDAMQAGRVAFEAWDAAYREVLVCRRVEAEELLAASQRRRDEHNAGAQGLNAFTMTWNTEIEEFNGRLPSGRASRPRTH